MTETRRHRVHILGAGIIGLSTAWELAQRGWRVTVWDKDRIGGGASWAGAGILPPAPKKNVDDPLDQLKSRSHQLHVQWAGRLMEQTGIDTGFRQCGGIHLALSKAEAATLAGNRYWWEEHGIEYEPLDAEQLEQLEPALGDAARKMVGQAWLLPEEYQLRNPWHLRSLAEACRRNHVELRPNCPVERIQVTSGRVTGLRLQHGECVPAERVCICTGAYARQFLLDLGCPNGIMPIRGQIVLYHAPQPLLRHVINVGNRYLVPRDDGRCLAGSVEEEVGYRIETTPEAINQLRAWAESVVPALRDIAVERTWAGLRPGSFDGLPYIGEVPGAAGTFVAAGHFRSGLHLSCATAEILADLVEGKPPQIDLTPFRVGRG